MSTGDTPERTPLEPADLVGSRIADRYVLTGFVSTGANTTIYEAADDQTGRAVTLKLLRPSIAASPSFRDRFDERMRAVSSLSHPNIVALYDWGIAPIGDLSTAFVVTEALGGGSLRDLFDRGRRLSPSQALTVGLDACRGLDHAHRRGFVHTELTPSKLVFGDDRRVRIADFGLAELLGAPVWEQPDSVPTHVAWYAAPEQGAGEPLDGRTDVYALCLSLHEAVTGELPFKNDSTVATLSARVGKLMPVSADLGPLAAVFERAGRPDIADRSTAAEFGKGLVQAASKLPRPEPLPLLSSGLFDTPADQMRTPDDPTGGVTRPSDQTGAAPVVVVPATPDDEPPPGDDEPDDRDAAAVTVGAAVAADAAGGAAFDDLPELEPYQEVTGGEALVILPLDSELDGGPDALLPESEPAAPVATARAVAEAPATAPMPVTPAPAAPVAPRRRRGALSWKLVLAAMVAVALIVLGVLASRLFRTPEYAVPDLVGVPEAEARNLVAANGWEISEQRERSDEVPEVGQVIRTVPGAGVFLAEGEPFLLVVSEGPLLRELPDVTGLPLGEAQTALVDRDLEVVIVEVYDEDIAPGIVISWSVPGDATLGTGSFVLPATPVELVVSQGPAPRTVPDVVGVATADARAAIEELSLVLVEERQEFSDDVALGNVISQTPEPGTEVARDTTVSVVVSRGPDLVTFPEIPDDATYEQAATILGEAGFVANLTFGDAQGQIIEMTIDGAAPDVGTTYRRGTQVDIRAI